MNVNLSFLLDFYELTMAQVYFKHKPNTQATFDLFIRSLPLNRSYCLVAGLEDCLDFLINIKFEAEQIEFLRGIKVFSEDFLDYLANFKFKGDVWALPEGSVCFANEPIIRITASLIHAQIVESFLLNTINIHSSITTKASRVVISAKGKAVYDFSLRRAQGIDASIKAARSSFIAGCAGTSNCMAGILYNIPLTGTMAHSFVMAFDNELDSFHSYAESFPDSTILLVDTYDYKKGIENAIKIAKELEQKNKRLKAIRLDSGDLCAVSKIARKTLDKNDLKYVRILASGNLDEYAITRLIKKGALIDSFGVGTKMGTSSDAPYLDVVYKLCEVCDNENDFLPKMKLSAAKITLPGRKQIFRFKNRKGIFKKDIIALEAESIKKAEPLLVNVIKDGKLMYNKPSIHDIVLFAKNNISSLSDKLKRIDKKANFIVKPSRALRKLKNKLIKQNSR
ncbi:MAG: nicotinate phosphoribosyltransferase [Candidatus Gygaella obscura]|nr:nicotinate phosphoribosyltransferase [Candidatus Gygaella obscura]